MDRQLKYNNLRVNQPPKGEKDEKAQTKVIPITPKKDQNGKTVITVMPYNQHPYAKLLRGTYPQIHQFKKFSMLFYKGLNYAVNNLKGPSEQFIKKKSVSLTQHKQLTREKFLMLDLDETLIHSIFDNEESDVTIDYQDNKFKFNIRPYCLQFLDKMSQYFSIYVFTASTIDYATPIVDYLNRKKKTIQGILHRKNCMETNHGFFIKDLRIIKNRNIQKIVIVDNLVHSFGLQIENGIPILDFTNNKKDTELYGLEKLLMEVWAAQKIPTFLKERLKLRKMLDHKEEDIIKYFDKKYD